MASAFENIVDEQFIDPVENMFGDFNSDYVYKENRNKIEYTLTIPSGIEMKYAEDIEHLASAFKDPYFCTIIWLDQNNKPYPKFVDILEDGNTICGICAWFTDLTELAWKL